MAMGDIAFNLLIFFVVLARAQDDSHLQWRPAKTPEIESVGQPRASITVDTKSKVYLDGRQVSVDDLAGQLEKLLGNAPKGKRTVLLKVHKEAQAVTFEPIIEAVSEAGGDLVHVLEEER